MASVHHSYPQQAGLSTPTRGHQGELEKLIWDGHCRAWGFNVLSLQHQVWSPLFFGDSDFVRAACPASGGLCQVE